MVWATCSEARIKKAVICGRGAVKEKYLTSFSADLSWLEIKNLNTAPGISSESKFSLESHVVSTIRGNTTKLALNHHSRPQSPSVLIDQKKRWALRMMVKGTCAHAQWRKPASKQTNGSISVRYNNLLDIVTPIFKSCNCEDPCNNRPIVDYLTASKTLAKTQSCNRKIYSTETALLCVTDDLLQAIDDKKISALVLLDMSKTWYSIAETTSSWCLLFMQWLVP